MGKSDLIWDKNGYNFDISFLVCFSPTQSVYIYNLKLVNLVVLQDLVGGLLVELVYPARKNRILFYFFILFCFFDMDETVKNGVILGIV